MNGTQVGATGAPRDLRVRDQVRETLALVAFTAAASGVCALAFLALGTLGR
jgi:hypothetical protein